MALLTALTVLAVAASPVGGGPANALRSGLVSLYAASQSWLVYGPNDGQTSDGRVVANPASFMVLVNKQWSLPAGYVPPDLVAPNVPSTSGPPKLLLRAKAAASAERLFAVARAEGVRLVAVSGYRSYEQQRKLFQHFVQRTGSEAEANRFSARPGQSEHQTGLAFDLTSPRVGFHLTQRFGETPEGRWLAEHAPRFGFIVRYPKGKHPITGYCYEPWHLRYVGVEVATEVARRQITLEEYLRHTH